MEEINTFFAIFSLCADNWGTLIPRINIESAIKFGSVLE
jgi:hypothetical protein